MFLALSVNVDSSHFTVSVPMSVALCMVQVLLVFSGELVPSGHHGRHAGKHVQHHWLLVGFMPSGDGDGDRSPW